MDRELVARYCWETNTNYAAVKLMLDLGFPVAHPERSHGYTPLHNAAWAGSGDLVELLIARGHPVDIRDPAYNATPLGYALYDCLVAKRHPEGEFARVVKALLEAGSPLKGVKYPTGHAASRRGPVPVCLGCELCTPRTTVGREYPVRHHLQPQCVAAQEIAHAARQPMECNDTPVGNSRR